MASRNYISSQLISLFENPPDATAVIKGSPQYSRISGKVEFYQTQIGVVVVSYITGLPFRLGRCEPNILAMHIHNGLCEGTAENPFENAGSHYNPHDCEHPAHAGDLPPLFVNRGYAFSVFLTERFNVREVLGLPVIIHDNRDDFTTQPSGDSGSMIACGTIESAKNLI